MKKFLFILTLVLIFYSNLSFAISKKKSLYQEGKFLHEWSFGAGKWVAWMRSCQGNGKFAQQIREEVANLSWPDFKKLNAGLSEWENKFVAGKCIASEVKKGKSYLKNYTRELSNLVRNKTGSELNKKPEKSYTLIYCKKSNGAVYTTISGPCVPDKKISKEEYQKIKKENKIKKEKKDDIETQLRKLKSLFKQKLITKEEYDQKRREILDEM